MRLSADYFLTYGGSCMKVPLKPNGQPDEWPYSFAKMKPCRKRGTHPHLVGRIRRLSKSQD